MELKEISESQLDEFVLNNDKSHFMQTSAWGDVSKTRNYKPYNLGLFDNEKLVGTALLLEKKILNYTSFYCPRGFIIDYNNKELIKEMINQLKSFVEKRNGLYFKINPDIIIRKLNEDGSIKEEYEDKLELIEFFKNNGGKHRGFTTKFTESSAPRFTFRVNVNKSDEDIISSYHNTTKKILKDKNPYHINITKNDSNALNDFYQTMKETSIRKKLYIEPFSYFENFYKKLNNKNEADIYVASVDVNELKNVLLNKLDNIKSEKEVLLSKSNNSKNQNLLKEIENKENKILKLQSEVNKVNEKRVVLSSIITAKFADKVWTIHGGNSDQLLFLNANYELYNHILFDSKNNNYKIVDFYGSEGVVDTSSPIYGIYLFKLRFGGDFDEFIGEFDFIIKPFAYKIINVLLIIRRRMLYIKSINKKQ